MFRRKFLSAIASLIPGFAFAGRPDSVKAVEPVMPDLKPPTKAPFPFAARPFYNDGRAGDPDNADQICKFTGCSVSLRREDTSLAIHSPKGVKIVNHGDWVIEDVDGEISHCSADIFDATFGSKFPITDVSAMPSSGVVRGSTYYEKAEAISTPSGWVSRCWVRTNDGSLRFVERPAELGPDGLLGEE